MNLICRIYKHKFTRLKRPRNKLYVEACCERKGCGECFQLLKDDTKLWK